jgi:putative tricarboxylic transport membrane protein
VSLIGVYSVDQRLFDSWLVGGFGLLGYLMRKMDYPAAPLLLGLVLGDLMENALRQSLMMSQGDVSILYSRPLAAVMLLLTVLVLIGPMFRRLNTWRLQAAEQEA